MYRSKVNAEDWQSAAVWADSACISKKKWSADHHVLPLVQRALCLLSQALTEHA